MTLLMIVITIVYLVLLVFIAFPLLLLVPIFALFGLPAYGPVMSKVILTIYLIAGATFPFALIIAIIGGWIGIAKHTPKLALILILLPVPQFLLFFVPCVIFAVEHPDKIARLTPAKLGEIFRDADPSKQKEDADLAKKQAQSKQNTKITNSKHGSYEQLAGYLQRAAARMKDTNYKGAAEDYEKYLSLIDRCPDKDELPERSLIIQYLANAYFLDEQNEKALNAINTAENIPQSVKSFLSLLSVRWKIYDKLGDQEKSFADQHMISDHALLFETYPFLKNPPPPRNPERRHPPLTDYVQYF